MKLNAAQSFALVVVTLFVLSALSVVALASNEDGERDPEQKEDGQGERETKENTRERNDGNEERREGERPDQADNERQRRIFQERKGQREMMRDAHRYLRRMRDSSPRRENRINDRDDVRERYVEDGQVFSERVKKAQNSNLRQTSDVRENNLREKKQNTRPGNNGGVVIINNFYINGDKISIGSDGELKRPMQKQNEKNERERTPGQGRDRIPDQDKREKDRRPDKMRVVKELTMRVREHKMNIKELEGRIQRLKNALENERMTDRERHKIRQTIEE